jgi:hypothetical protein
MVNYIKAAIDLGRPVVKAVGEAFDALGNKIGALPSVADPTDTGWVFKDLKKPILNKEENRMFNSGMMQGEVTVLPIRSMYASQPKVNPDFASTEASSGSLPLVIKKGGELFVSDGHHRLTKLASEGEQNARVRLVDLDGPTDTPLLDYDPNKAAEDQALLDELFGALPNPVLKTDNPGGDWLADKIRYAEEDRLKYPQDTYASNLGNSAGVTGWISEPIMLNPNLLANFKGAMGEEKIRASSPKLKNLQDNIASEGYKPDTILIHVREDGVPFIIEGNHRVAEAVASNRGSIPVEIKYLRGAENVDGPLNPTLLGAKK